MKIALVNPQRQYSAPYLPNSLFLGGIGYIDSALRQAGHEVVTLNMMGGETSLDKIADCDTVGITSYIDCYGFFKDFLPKMKGKRIIVGGPLISSYGRTTDNLLMRLFPEIDVAVIGEGEITAVHLMNALQKGDISGVKGIVFREGDNLTATERQEMPEDLDQLPQVEHVRWKGLPEAIRNSAMEMSTARGCYNQCTFCFKLMPGLRTFSPERVRSDLGRIAKYGASSINLNDEEFMHDRNRTSRISEIFAEQGMPFHIQTRVNDADYQILKYMAEHGCILVRYGIESFNEEVLRRNNKNITVKQIYEAIETTRKAGLPALGFILLGLPGETRKSLEETIRGVKETGIHPRPRLLMPLPGTQIYREAVEKGLIKEEELLRNYSTHYDTTFGNFVPINLTEVSDQELLDARDRIKEIGKMTDNRICADGEQ